MPKPMTYGSSVYIRIEPALKERMKQLKRPEEKEADLWRRAILEWVEREEKKANRKA